jgi:hypothetical protein
MGHGSGHGHAGVEAPSASRQVSHWRAHVVQQAQAFAHVGSAMPWPGCGVGAGQVL